jgi:exosortase
MATQTQTLAPPRSFSAAGASLGIFVAAAVIVVAHAPLLAVQAQRLWLKPHYQFFPLALVGSAILAVERLRQPGPVSPGSPLYSYFLAGFCWLLLAAAELVDSSWLATVAAVALGPTLLYALGGKTLLQRSLPAWILLLLVIPPPFNWDNRLVVGLQHVTTQWSSKALDLLGVYHVMSGNVVEIAGRRLLVEEACAGVNSLFSVLACTLFFVFFTRRPFLRGVLLILATIAWVLLANVARVVAVAYLSSVWGIDVAEGWRHDALGFLLFGVALCLIWSSDRLLLLLSPARARVQRVTNGLGEKEVQTSDGPAMAPEQPKGGLGCWLLAAAYSLIILAHFGLRDANAADIDSGPGVVAACIPHLKADTLPAQFETWQQKAFGHDTRNPGSAYGEFSTFWTYRRGNLAAVFSLDHPFSDWHELPECYTSQGWTIEDESFHRLKTGGTDSAGAFVEVRLARPGYRSGHLFFCLVNDHGAFLDPPHFRKIRSEKQAGPLDLLWDRLQGKTAPRRHAPCSIFQVQLFVEGSLPLGDDDRTGAAALFGNGLEMLRRQWASD